MSPARKRLVLLLSSLPFLVLLLAAVYMAAMQRLEGQARTFLESLLWAAETVTTTGYGIIDGSWEHPVMVLFVIVTQFFGVILIYMIVPFYLIPILEERFEARLPRKLSEKLSGHVVIYRYGPAVESLVEELEQADRAFVVIEHDESVARRLKERGQRVVVADVASALEGVCLESANALIANASDEENAAMMLVAQQLEFEGEIVALVEEPIHRRPMNLAGASMVYTPRHILAAALAARASHRISPRVSGIQQIGKHLRVAELRVSPRCEIAGKTLREARIGASTGAVVIGQWIGGRLETQPAAETVITPRGILVAVGSSDALERLAKQTASAGAHRTGPFVIGGAGEVGRKLRDLLGDVGEETRMIDIHPGRGADLVGDILDPDVLEEAGARDAQAIVLALDSDSATLFATVIIQDWAPEIPIIARVNEADNVERIHRAGADFALSISQVSGQMLAQRLLGREAIAIDPHLKVVRSSGGNLHGRSVSSLRLRETTGCSVVGVERDDELRVDLGSDFVFDAHDDVYVCGSTTAIQSYLRTFGG